MYIKKGNKHTMFTPFSDQEKTAYSLKVMPLGESCAAADDPGSRALTVMDDFMQSMQFAEKLAQEGQTNLATIYNTSNNQSMINYQPTTVNHISFNLYLIYVIVSLSFVRCQPYAFVLLRFMI